MAYHIDEKNISLGEFQQRIESTDLIPSRTCLIERISERIQALEQQGITSLASLREALKNPKRLAAVAESTGIDPQYLTLLRREAESYFPQPVALKAFDGLPKEDIAKLEQQNVGDTASLYELASTAEKRSELAQSLGVDALTLEKLAQLADLVRVQWVSPTFARMLIAAGYESAAKVAAANPAELFEALETINPGDRFFKGKIGLRDIKRLIHAASYV